MSSSDIIMKKEWETFEKVYEGDPSVSFHLAYEITAFFTHS
jgi:hypothetical protein